ncbi:BT_3987 domain-containing protein [Sphingobacterium chuzhouense]|uniref:DUF1735 domain-containing protein n=1 Tax=Sphingobacterium chuzhouense TaxID=1742264 RepID=A0ABR7XRT7_9SPHI|nr:DUF1735 domain-containing protein [Sphingobacterium chuzhouense]MBD1421884.1 DUF1735 domain-containing protein [Sphingobacterium chuzhouense]
MKRDIKLIFNMTAKYITIFITATFILLFWQNCKVPEYPIENEESYSKIFMQLASDGAVEQSLPIKDEWTTITFGAGYGGLIPLTQNVQVTFEIAQEEVDSYNQQNNTNYELPPLDSYKLNNTTAEIQAGKTGSNSVSLDVNPLKLNGTRSYLLPITISNVTPDIPVSESLKTTYFIINGFYETNPYDPLPKGDWTIHDFSSQASDGNAVDAIDGNLATHWLSEWRRDDNNQRPVHPHHITVDMENSHLLHGLQIYGRRPSGSQGPTSQDYLFPRNIHIETSNDGTTWQSAGIFSMTATPSGAPEATLYFEQAVTCQYFKVTVLNSTSANGDTTGIAELIAF